MGMRMPLPLFTVSVVPGLFNAVAIHSFIQYVKAYLHVPAIVPVKKDTEINT